MKQLYKKITRFFSDTSALALTEPSWEAEYLAQKFMKQYMMYPEAEVRAAVHAVLQHAAVPQPGDSLLDEVLEELKAGGAGR